MNNNPINKKPDKKDNEIDLDINVNNNTPKQILEKIYNLFPSSNLKYKNVKIGNMFFRILFYNSQKSKNNSKQSFVDILYNYNEIKSNINNNDSNENTILEYTSIQEPYVIIYDIIEPIKLDYPLIKSIKMKDNQSEVIKNLFFIRTNYIEYFLNWCEIFNKNSYNIKKYDDLKYFMKKYVINQNLLFFSLVKINNKEISDIIKIHLLVKAFKFIFFNQDNEYLLNEIKKCKKNNELNKEININENLISKLIFYIKSIIYPNELLPIGKNKFKEIYEQLLFYSNILFFRYKLIDDYLSLGLLNNDNIKNNSIYSFFNIKSPQEFLKHIILISRKKPFLFISEMEKQLNFAIDPFVKFKCSISIESMSHQLDVVHVNLIDNIIKSFVNPDEISGLFLTKIIKKYRDKDYYNEPENKNVNINPVFINNIYKYSEKAKIFMNKDNNKIAEKPNLNKNSSSTNSKENILKIKNNKMNNNNDIEKEEKKTNFENESENKNEDNKSNISIMNFNTNNNSQILLRNNSNGNNAHNNSNEISNIDNNEIITKISSDKTMDETDTSNTKISNIATNDISSKNNYKTNSNTNKINNVQNINLKNIKEIYENIILLLPPNCYKTLYNFENKTKNRILYPNLEQYYIIKNIQIVKEWANNNENIFKILHNSYNGDCEYTLIKSYIFYF